jgi:hypothetical protein
MTSFRSAVSTPPILPPAQYSGYNHSMDKCWAKSLGDCSDKMSGEHLVTAGIFSTDKVMVQGFSWCKDVRKEIGLNSLVRKVLCRDHNSQLSPLDDAVIGLFQALNDCTRLSDVRNSLPPRRWTRANFDVDGKKLERWCLKTLITLSLGGSMPLGPKSKDSSAPHEDLVALCYDRLQFVFPAGLYVSYEPGDSITLEDRVTVGPINRDDNFIVGARFSLGGFHLMLYIDDRPFQPGPITFNRKDGTSERRPPPLYRTKALNFQIGKYVSHSLRFIWD